MLVAPEIGLLSVGVSPRAGDLMTYTAPEASLQHHCSETSSFLLNLPERHKMTRRVLILGGSMAGLAIAHRLLKYTLPQQPDLHVTLVSKVGLMFCSNICCD